MTPVQNKFEELLEKQRQLKLQFQNEAQELFKQTTKEFFDKNPSITAIVWTQYTPYFNDGDACEFRVGEPHFTNAKNLQWLTSWGEYEGDEEGVFSVSSVKYVMEAKSEYYEAERQAIINAGGVDVESCESFSKIIQSSEMEDVMLAMFDDHVRVLATRDGFDVEEYEHD